MTDWMNTETFWLNATNALLGLFTLVALLLVLVAAGHDIAAKWRAMRAAAREGVDLHAMQVPALGLTMADGGEKVEEKEAAKVVTSGKEERHDG